MYIQPEKTTKRMAQETKPGLLEQYRGEPSETSSMTEGEMKKILEKEGIAVEEKKQEGEQKGGLLGTLRRGLMPTMPKPEDMEKARKTPEYSELMKKFEEEYGKDRPKQRDIDDIGRKLDNRYKILHEHTGEVGRSDCDMQLYRNKILKDLGDVINDLQEAHNIINILMSDRNVLKDLFAIFSIQIKGLMALNRSLEEDLGNRDKMVEKLKAALEAAQAETEKVKAQIDAMKKSYLDMKNENNQLKREAADAKADAARMKRQVDVQADEIDRLRKEVERLKSQVKDKQDELERLRPELPRLRDGAAKLLAENDGLKAENARLKKENDGMKEDMQALIKKANEATAENRDLKTQLKNALDTIRSLGEEVKALKAEIKDLKPNNDLLTKKVEDLSKDMDGLMDECGKLKKEPQMLKDTLIPQIDELKNVNSTLKDENDKLKRENDTLKRDLDEMIEERKKRNNDRRKRKEDQLKRIVGDAHKSLDEAQKKQDEKKSTIEATELINNAKIAQQDLDKYPKLETKVQDPNTAALGGEIDVMIPEMPRIDADLMDQPTSAFVRREGGIGTGTGGTPGFEVMEPLIGERAPYKTIAAESQALSYTAAPIQSWDEEPLYYENDPQCPYGHIEYEAGMYPPYASVGAFEQNPEKSAVLRNAKEFLERARTDPRLRDLLEKQFPGLSIEEIVNSQDYYDLALRLLELMKKYRQTGSGLVEEKAAPPPPPPLTDADIRTLLDNKLRLDYTIKPDDPGKLFGTLKVGDSGKFADRGYQDILTNLVPKIRPLMDVRGTTPPPQVVNDYVRANHVDIEEMIRRLFERPPPPPPVTPPSKKEEEEDLEIMTPGSMKSGIMGGLGKRLAKIVREIASKQKEGVTEYRKVDPSTGKVTWCNTHMIFVIDCSGSMMGKRWRAVGDGYLRCLELLQGMQNIIVSSYTFDDKAYDYVKEMEPRVAAKIKEKLPFKKGDKTDYRIAMDKAIKLLTTESNPKFKDYLACVMFLSDGKGGYPEEQVNQLAELKKAGRKTLFFTFACETEEDEDLKRMATTLAGEHYKVLDAEAMRRAFQTILST